MTPLKRLFDLASAVVLTAVLWPMVIWITLLILIRDGRPVFYVAERMKTPDQPFGLIKFRTMSNDPGDRGVSGGDKTSRITRTGRWLRRYRLDEVPQLWNVFRGDISFVGPRPPLRRYVEMFPELYAEVLKSRPGITGMATLMVHAREDRLLSQCTSPDETEAVYVRRCVPIKARIDLIYARHSNVCLDFTLMCASVTRRMPGRRRR
jgi:lipopolysaccharide/colanic/teichoic acid biosynthesis glycosyltransferase